MMVPFDEKYQREMYKKFDCPEFRELQRLKQFKPKTYANINGVVNKIYEISFHRYQANSKRLQYFVVFDYTWTKRTISRQIDQMEVQDYVNGNWLGQTDDPTDPWIYSVPYHWVSRQITENIGIIELYRLFDIVKAPDGQGDMDILNQWRPAFIDEDCIMRNHGIKLPCAERKYRIGCNLPLLRNSTIEKMKRTREANRNAAAGGAQ